MNRLVALALTATVVGCDGVLEVVSTDLEVRTTVEPDRVPLGGEPPVVQLTIAVTNPFNRTVTVDLGGPPYEWGPDLRESVGVAFGYRIHARDGGAGGPGAVTLGQPSFKFGPRETKDRTFAVEVGGEEWSTPRPVEYEVIGSFGRQLAAPAALQITLPMQDGGAR